MPSTYTRDALLVYDGTLNDAEFDGYRCGRLYRVDGRRWVQISDTTKPSTWITRYSPRCRLFERDGIYFLDIEGMSEMVEIEKYNLNKHGVL
jgi:hypothetical protein